MPVENGRVHEVNWLKKSPESHVVSSDSDKRTRTQLYIALSVIPKLHPVFRKEILGLTNDIFALARAANVSDQVTFDAVHTRIVDVTTNLFALEIPTVTIAVERVVAGGMTIFPEITYAPSQKICQSHELRHKL